MTEHCPLVWCHCVTQFYVLTSKSNCLENYFCNDLLLSSGLVATVNNTYQWILSHHFREYFLLENNLQLALMTYRPLHDLWPVPKFAQEGPPMLPPTKLYHHGLDGFPDNFLHLCINYANYLLRHHILHRQSDTLERVPLCCPLITYIIIDSTVLQIIR